MSNQIELEEKKQSETLESEVKKFADGLPYWSKYLAEKRFSGLEITDEIVSTAYSYLLEELELKDKTDKPAINLNPSSQQIGKYKRDLFLTKVEDVEGVNALIEGQKIEFGNNLTVIYGTNGSGKSGYTRLLKQVFYSKSPEDILKNIHIADGHKPVNAKFTFTSSSEESSFLFAERSNAEFKQFSVFDGKSVIRHLDQRNEFEFRPAGLGFFADFTGAISKVEQKMSFDLDLKKAGHTVQDLGDLFEGESEIKEIVKAINAKTKLSDLQKLTPFSEDDKVQKAKIDKAYDELLLPSKNKEREIKQLQTNKKLLGENRLALEKLNQYFNADYIKKIVNSIQDYLDKEAIAKSEGIENFKTEKVLQVGSKEWKDLILSAENFAKKQTDGQMEYPNLGDNCLLCHQPLSEEAVRLISNYWVFIKSVAEENANKALETLNKLEVGLSKFNFDLFPDDNTLTTWLDEKYPKELEEIKRSLESQKLLCEEIVSNVKNKHIKEFHSIQIPLLHHQTIEANIDASIRILGKDEQLKELERLEKSKTFLSHKEKFNTHFSKFQSSLENQQWIAKAGKANFRKSKTETTNTEKALSDKYFNQRYIDAFNEECKKLNGNFGIEVSHTGSAGKSYRQLKLKGNNPHAVLSEGEQKVIAIADFLAEMKLSEINRGIVFDDPVTSLDETRKSEIAKRLVQECKDKQTIIFTHDLVFVSSLIGHCADRTVEHVCHWIENRNGSPGQIWLNNSPSYEKEYRNAEPSKKHYNEAKKEDCSPMQREFLLKAGFASLRTSYEVLVINDLFKNVVQRFNERVSIDSLNSVYFDSDLIEELQDSFGECCRYMEGHTHSDKYAYKKPEPINLNEEIQRFEAIRTKIRKYKKPTT